MDYLLKNLTGMLSVCATAIAINACSSMDSEADNLASAREYADAAEYDSAQSICDRIREKIYSAPKPEDTEALTELSLIYMHIADADDRQEDVSFAYWCYQEAFRQDSAKAAEIYAATDVDDLPLVSILNSISAIATGSRDIADFTDELDTLLLEQPKEPIKKPVKRTKHRKRRK